MMVDDTQPVEIQSEHNETIVSGDIMSGEWIHAKDMESLDLSRHR